VAVEDAEGDVVGTGGADVVRTANETSVDWSDAATILVGKKVDGAVVSRAVLNPGIAAVEATLSRPVVESGTRPTALDENVLNVVCGDVTVSVVPGGMVLAGALGVSTSEPMVVLT